jgi:hypothetical protein
VSLTGVAFKLVKKDWSRSQMRIAASHSIFNFESFIDSSFFIKISVLGPMF